MSSPIEVKDLWTAAGVLLGFQITAFSWRITQESRLAKEGELVWLPPADYLNLLAMLVTVVGVFVAPLFEAVDASRARVLFGLAALLFVGHAFALAGHYELFSRGRKRSFVWWSRQEKVVMSVVSLAVVAYLVTVAPVWRTGAP